ncbi:MAG: flagellar biosynthetic protein FliO [Candidatus Hydrogenedentes bacterium]|nr:flagellar biosynthetic protein FliO [Candidatus Hydrogenedentota bacterium]
MLRQKKLSGCTLFCLALALSPCLLAQEPAELDPGLLELNDAGATDAAPQSQELTPASETPPDEATPDPFIEALNRELDEPTTDSTPEVADQPEAEPTSGFIYYIRVFSAFCVVIALILLTGYLVRKLGKRIPLLAGAELGTILGRVYLARGTALHFVKTGGRVLVLGITNNSISLLKEFDADEFEALHAPSSNESENANEGDFLAQFEESSRILRGSGQIALNDAEDDDISSLRGDIRRLREFIKRDSGEPED